MRRFVLLLILVGLLTASGCDSKPAETKPGKVTSEDVRRDAGKAVDTAVEFSQQAKVEFQKRLDLPLKELDAEIAMLRERGNNLKDEAKADWDKKMADLETKREAASAKLAEVGHSSAEAWKDIQSGAQAAWDDLDKAFREASREF